MRSKAKYLKALQAWASELSIHGKIVDKGRHSIVSALVGREKDITEFLKRWKSEKVDVDSRGKPCKERMMEVLYHKQLADSKLPDLRYPYHTAWYTYICLKFMPVCAYTDIDKCFL